MGQADEQQGRGPWRASDAEREQVAERLRRAMAEGRLSCTELEERLSAVYSAKTHDQLEPLTTDLPAPAMSGSTSWGTDNPATPRPPGPGPTRDAWRRRPTNTMAILSLVFAFAFFPLGTVFGVIARRQITRTGEEGRGLALAGILISLAHVLLFVAMGVFIAVMAVNHSVPTP